MELFSHFGSGDKIVVALGGYKQDMHSFDTLIQKTKDIFRWILVHLPLINSENEQVLSPDTLLHLIHNEIKKYPYQKVYLLGFSIGGRIAQTLFLLAPQCFDKLILINADGLKKHFLQWITEKKWISIHLLYKWIEQYKLWKFIIKTGQKIGFISPKRAYFYLKHIESTQQRKMLIKIWKEYSHFKPKFKNLLSHKDKVILIWGRQDQILSVRTAERLSHKYRFRLLCVEGGHNIIQTKPNLLSDILKSI
ncbi:MAG: alpha/beta hydrolase [Bacteroidia bacterium]|nr:alpha/beta hydrolase [Bacteroidia bacterium]MDW8346900.1 alpha/beta hydrolase [Bacteroidia bacterium]